MQPTEGEWMTRIEQSGNRDLDELLGISTTSMDFDPSSLEGEAQLQAYVQIKQVSNDTDPLMWWKTLSTKESFLTWSVEWVLYRLTCGGGSIK
jgi:hypothetical protein